MKFEGFSMFNIPSTYIFWASGIYTIGPILMSGIFYPPQLSPY